MPSKTAKALVAGLAVVGAAAGVQANSNPQTNDVQALNYALGLEHLEAAFYVRGLARYDAAAFAAAGYSQGVRDYITLIGAHETAHVTALTNTITGSYNAVPGVACASYNFADTTVKQFLRTAITLEDVGVSAYVAALNHISNQDVQQAAATIATVEARHAAFLRALAGAESDPANTNPFPEAVNTARVPDQVVSAQVAGPFFPAAPTDGSAPDQCLNFTQALPAVRPAGVATNNTLANFKASSATPSANPTYTQAQFDTDLSILNYALTLEHLEADFYNTFASRFDAAAYNAIPGLNARGATGASIVTNIGLIRDHENAHVGALRSIITGRGGANVTAGCYDWSSITTAAQFLQVAQVLENTGVSAYDGAANGITDTGLQQTAAAVAVVEARHAQYLNFLNNQTVQTSTLNQATDTPQTIAQISTLVSGLPYVRNGQLTGGCRAVSSSSGAASSSSGTNNNDGNSGALVAPIAIVSTLLAFASALLF